MSSTKNLTMIEKFEQIRKKFNNTYLTTLYQLTMLADDPETKEEQICKQAVDAAYAKWFPILQQDPYSTESCDLFHDAVSPYHELMLAKDTQIFDIDGDLFSKIYNVEGIDSRALYESLRDGLDEEDPSLAEEEKDARANLWDALITQYQLAVIVCLYIRTPLVKNIIDMILVNNPDLNQQNVFNRVLGQKNRRLRKMIIKLLKGDKKKFMEIFNSMQRVISIFSSEVNISKSMSQKAQMAQQQIQTRFKEIMIDHELKLNEEQVGQFIQCMEKRDDAIKEALIGQALTEEQFNKMELEYKLRGLDKLDVTKIAGNMGQTMEDMFKAIEKGDKTQLDNLLEKTATSANLDSEAFKNIQSEMEEMSAELGDDADFLQDDDDDEEEDQD